MSIRLARPNFFILGSAKCGTTSLHHSLGQHPAIHLASVKEPCFFSRSFQVVKNPVDYFHLFPKTPGKIIHGEASHSYLTDPETAPVLASLFPDARFVLIVRHPVDRSHSLYHFMRHHGLESCATFEEALAAEPARRKSTEFQENCPQYFWNYLYAESSRYDVQFARYLEYFPCRQFMLLTLGEWKTDPVSWQRKIFEFLGVDPSFRVTVEPQNQSAPHAPLAEKTRRALEQQFIGVRERLERLAGREFQHWDF